MKWIFLIIFAVIFGLFGILKTKDFDSSKSAVGLLLMYLTSSLVFKFSPLLDNFIQNIPESERVPVSFFIYICGFVTWSGAFMFFGELLKMKFQDRKLH